MVKTNCFKEFGKICIVECDGDDRPIVLYIGRHIFCIAGAWHIRAYSFEPRNPHIQFYPWQRSDDRHGRRYKIFHSKKPTGSAVC